MSEIETIIENEEGLFKSVSLKLPTNFVSEEKLENINKKLVESQEKLHQTFKDLSETFSEKFIPKQTKLPANDNDSESEISEDLYKRTNEKITSKLQDLIDGTKHVFDSLDAIRRGDETWRKNEEIDEKKERSKLQELRNEGEADNDNEIPFLNQKKNKNFFQKLSEGMVKKGIFSKVLGSAVVGGMIGSFIPNIISKVFGTLRMWLPNFMGNILDKVEDGLTSGKISKALGGAMKWIKIASGIAAVAGSIYMIAQDTLKSEILSKKWKTTKFSTIIGATLGSTSSGWMNAFKQAGKYGILGAGIGFTFGGPPGAIVGGIVGASLGAILGFFGGKWISRKIDAATNKIKRFSDKILGTSFILDEKELKKSEKSIIKDIEEKKRIIIKNEEVLKKYSKMIEKAKLKGNRYLERRLKTQVKFFQDQNFNLKEDIEHFERNLSQIKKDIISARGWWRNKVIEGKKIVKNKLLSFQTILFDHIISVNDSMVWFKDKISGFFTNIIKKIRDFSIRDWIPSIIKKEPKKLSNKNIHVVPTKKKENLERLVELNAKKKNRENDSYKNVESLNREDRFPDRPEPAKVIQMSEMFDKKKEAKKTKEHMTAISSIGSMSVNSNNRSSSTIINPTSSFNNDNSITRMRNRFLGGDKR